MKQKAFFINFEGLSVVKNCLSPEIAILILATYTLSNLVSNHSNFLLIINFDQVC